MEYQVNIIFILCFSIVESIPYSEDGRYGAQQASNWPTNYNQPRQYQNQNYARPQNYPAAKHANTGSYNLDSRPYERNNENRYSTLSNGSGEKKPFYEGPNGRKKPYYQPTVSGTPVGTSFKEKSSLETVPQTYRPMRQHNEYDDRNNGRYLPLVEENYQQPVNRPYYNPRVPYQRSVSENYGNRYRDTPQQKSRYFDKSGTSQNISPSSSVHRYPYQNRALASTTESLRPVPNAVHNLTPELPITSHPRNEINEILSDPEIQNYLASNHKRYLVLHSNGTVEHIDSLESIVQKYPSYVMVKAGDIIKNPKNSNLELIPPATTEEIIPKIPEVVQNIPQDPIHLTAHGYKARASYVTEKAYEQPTDGTVNIQREDAEITDDAALIIPSTPTQMDSSTFFAETLAEQYTTPFVEVTTEYNNLSSLLEYDTTAPIVVTAEYDTPIPFDETTTEYTPYIDTTSEFASTTVPISVSEDQTFTEKPIEITTEDQPITDAQFMVTTEDYSTLLPMAIKSNEEYLESIPPYENDKALQEERQSDMMSKLFKYPTAFSNFLHHHFGALFPVNELNNSSNNKIARRMREVAPASDSLDITDIIEAVTQLAIADPTTTETEDVLLISNDSLNAGNALMEDFINVTPTLIDTSDSSDDYDKTYSETSSSFVGKEGQENSDVLNPFADISDAFNPHYRGSSEHHQNKSFKKMIEIPYNLRASDDYGTPSTYATVDYVTNPFISFITEVTPNPFDDFSVEDTLPSTERELYSRSNIIVENCYEDATNPFIESTQKEAEYKKNPKRRRRNKKKFKPTTETYSRESTNPFITTFNESNRNLNVEIPDPIPDTLIESANEIVSNPFTDTNPFIQHLKTVSYMSNTPNPYTEIYSDKIMTPEGKGKPEADETSLDYGPENSYDTNIVPYAYLPSDTSTYELNTTPNPDYDINAESHNYDEIIPTTNTNTEDLIVLSTTEKPSVWFKTDADFWEKLSNGAVPYDVVYFFQVHAQPLVEKDTKTTIFPNGTIVQEFIETLWEREGNSQPIVVKTTKTTYPEETSETFT